MSKFIPDVGDFCYITFRPRKIVRALAYGGAETEISQGRSYSDAVFRMVAYDKVLAVLEFEAGRWFRDKNDRRISVRLSEVTFDPVSPDILAALKEQRA